MNRSRRLRILLINPNTNAGLTRLMQRSARTVQCSQTELHCINPPAGPAAIESTADRDAAAAALLRLVQAETCRGFDALILACFDDIALQEIRQSLSIPVVGLCEAAIAAASALPGRFAIVTTVEAAVPGIQAMLHVYGASDRACVRAACIGVSEAASNGDLAAEKIDACIRTSMQQDGAKSIILGSGGLTGRATELQRRFGIPVTDPVQSAVALAEHRARQRLPQDSGAGTLT
ncbi:aspartate/glutamate racemase family protein [Marinobacterium rhizophilum]|uniref:Aspartate/glutamate racemase family protein n=1 Tax=Marinobacterium rhizophilum TaxID=420402 RepID=A0ABY5HF21_9GAMM|nr:aspartate/glutamate racemase family protein [Marinobacterium rhizophilum]UTW10951.1 aspartate/glutamate racemase family protein [Marinobacterium rhizophilum]